MIKLDKNGRYLLACSFGPDSMALFDMLLKGEIHFDVAHVNYHLRKESDYEEQSLRNYCKDHSITIFVKNNDLSINRNVEETCRNIRYDFFAELYQKNKYDSLLVAHNEDDVIETYFLQKERKNLVKFYGIAEKTVINGMVVCRPLLSYKKADLLKYCNDNKVPYSIDVTNLAPIYKRNKIRLDIVSKMKDEERSRVLAEIHNKNIELAKLSKKLDKIEPKIDQLLKLDNIELAYYLNNLANKDKYEFNITYKQIVEIRKVLSSENPNVLLLLNKGKFVLVKSYGYIKIVPNDIFSAYSYVVEKPQIMDNAFFYANLLGDTSNRNIKPSDYPLTIRTYRKGDKYLIKDYYVQVRRLFIDWKMPVDVRNRWPIIVNKDGMIIYIPRYKASFKPEKDSNFYVKECFTLN